MLGGHQTGQGRGITASYANTHPPETSQQKLSSPAPARNLMDLSSFSPNDKQMLSEIFQRRRYGINIYNLYIVFTNSSL